MTTEMLDDTIEYLEGIREAYKAKAIGEREVTALTFCLGESLMGIDPDDERSVPDIVQTCIAAHKTAHKILDDLNKQYEN